MTKKLLALILVVVMLSASMFGCAKKSVENEETGANDNTINTENGAGSTQDTDNGAETDNEEQHIHAFGDWTTVKEATTDTDGKQERSCECGEKEERIIAATGKEFTVVYRNIKSAEYPTPNGYNSSEGLLILPEITANGYRFVGWYTASSGGDLVDYIPKGNTGDVILFAHWETIEYEITYRDVPEVTNPTTYTIETSLKLTTPKWSGLAFSHWTDESGNVYKPEGNITSIPKQTYGDLVLTAHWKVLRNIATPTNAQRELISAYSGENGYVYMIFELGTIEHVVLDNILPDMYYKYEGMPISLSLSQTLSVSEETAQSVSKTVSKSVSSTSSYSYASNWASTNSNSQNGNIGSSIGSKLEVKDVAAISASIETSIGYENSNSTSWGSTFGRESSSSSSSSTSNSVTNTIAYKKDLSSSVTEDITIDASLPSGYYAYVHAANIIVFGVVTYEVSTGNYYLDTYSRLDNMHSMMMYYSNVNQLNNPTVEGLDFNIPEEKILNFVNSFYFVEYDANGGEGKMETSLHSVGGSEHLSANQFTKTGYSFAGWELRTASGVKVLLDGQAVTNLGQPKEVVKLVALWAENAPPTPEITSTTKTGWICKSSSSNPGLQYSAVIECKNRTATTVDIRITWTTTISAQSYTVYGQKFNFSVGSTKSSTVTVAAFNTWKSASSSARSKTAESGWVTVPVDSINATTVDISIYYWQVNSNNTDMNKYDGTPAVKTTWTVEIPPYRA